MRIYTGEDETGKKGRKGQNDYSNNDTLKTGRWEGDS